jgi:hypothetical protein
MEKPSQENERSSEPAESESTDPLLEDVIEIEYDAEKKCGRCTFRSATHYRLESETDNLSMCGSCLASWLHEQDAQVVRAVSQPVVVASETEQQALGTVIEAAKNEERAMANCPDMQDDRERLTNALAAVENLLENAQDTASSP